MYIHCLDQMHTSGIARPRLGVSIAQDLTMAPAGLHVLYHDKHGAVPLSADHAHMSPMSFDAMLIGADKMSVFGLVGVAVR